MMTLEEAERKARQDTEAAFGNEKSLVNRIINCAHDGLELARPHTFQDDWLLANLALAIRSVNTLRVAHENLLNGYPVQAVALMRLIFEDYLTARYIFKNPTDVRYWWDPKFGQRLGKLPSQKQQTTGAIPAVAPPQDNIPKDKKLIKVEADGDAAVEKQLTEMNHYLSQFVHSRYSGLAMEVNNTPDHIYLYLGGEYRAGAVLYAYNALTGVGIYAARLAGAFAGHADVSWMDTFDLINRDWASWKAVYDAGKHPLPPS